MSNLQNIFYDNVGERVWDTYGREYPIKEHSNWKFVNIGKDKVGVSTLENKIEIRSFDDFQFIYVFKGLSQTHPCLAMEYIIFRRMRKVKVSPSQFKQMNKIN
jgi:hypothetical protein